MTKRTALLNENQMSFADLGLMEAHPAVTAAAKPKKATKKKAAVKSDDAATKALQALLPAVEDIGYHLQEKLEANQTAHRELKKVALSVSVEDAETLLALIAMANKAVSAVN